jgi:phosphatidylethanolamine-binding protein
MSLDPLSNVVSALEREQIIPDVIPQSVGFAPTHLFSILYPSGGGKEVMLGNTFEKQETQDEPIVSFTPMNIPVEQADSTGDDGAQDLSYTLVMLDPDVPSRETPENRSFRHWVVSIPSCLRQLRRF